MESSKQLKKEDFQLVQVETKSQNKAVAVGKSFYNVAFRVWTISGFCSAVSNRSELAKRICQQHWIDVVNLLL